MSEREFGWVIDVCRTCHREAKWPFCEHRDQGPNWCVPVVVVPKAPKKTAKLLGDTPDECQE
jgi:hypothetical protein